MQSQAGLPQDKQTLDPQVPVPESFPGGTSGAPPNPAIPVPTVVAGMASNGPSGLPILPTEVSGQSNSDTTPGRAVPAALFSYNAHSISNTSGSLERPAPSVSMSSTTVSSLTPVYAPGQTSSVGVSYNFAHAGSDLSNIQQFRANMNNLATQEAGVVPPGSSLLMNTPNFAPRNPWMSTPRSFSIPSGVSGTIGTPGTPGIMLPTSSSSNQAVPPGTVETTLPAVPRPGLPVGSNSAALQHTYSPDLHLQGMTAIPQGPWIQTPQMGVLPRPPYLPYAAAFPTRFPVPAHCMAPPPVLVPGSQPLSVTPVGNTGAVPRSSAPALASANTTGMQMDIYPPGIDNSKNVLAAFVNNASSVNEGSDTWTAHKTDSGILYYYNAITGESTYEKPSDFKGEPDKVPVQPTPVSMENIEGTDWALVSTSDGRKYYYNSKTKVSSWQVPTEVSELRNKQEAEEPKEHSKLVPNAEALSEIGSAAASMSLPSADSVGQDAVPPRASGVSCSTPALDLIKRKLQESGAPDMSSPIAVTSGAAVSEADVLKSVETTAKSQPSENSKDRKRDHNGDENMSGSSDSEDEDTGPTKEECITQFKEMLKERGVAPFSKWEKELPKIVFDQRFKAIPNHSARRALFDRFVKTRAEEERKEKRAAHKAAIEGFKQLLEEASEDIDNNTEYQTFKRRWGDDPRFLALERKEKEALLNERVLPLKKAAEEKARAVYEAAASGFKAMLRERGDIISINSRWSKVKDSLRNDPRYKSVKHDDREILFDEYVSDLKTAAEKIQREAKVKRDEQDKLKERERELRKRKEREEQEVERVKLKVRRKEAIASFQALLVETIRDPQASWSESKLKLEKDPQKRASNSDLDPSDMEKLFREHIKSLHERCLQEFKALLAEAISCEGPAQETDEKTVLNSWSTAKRLLKRDPRYSKCPRKDREVLWRRYADDVLRRQKSALNHSEDRQLDGRTRNSADPSRLLSGSRRTDERR